MQIKEMLEYQKLDGEIRKLENSLKNSEERKNATKMQDYIKDGQAKILSLEKTGEKLLSVYKKAVQAYNDFTAKLDKLLKETVGESPEEITRMLEKANTFMLANAKLEKDLESLQVSIMKVNNEFDVIKKSSLTAKNNFAVYKAKYNELRAKIEPEINKLKEQREKLQGKISSNLLTTYKQKSESKYPVFVPMKDNRCGGCRMEISGTKLKQLKEVGFIECENCGRVIYIQ